MYSGYVMFCWIYGVCNGGYAYTLKMYIYEKVRARNFARAWSFTQMAMGLALVIGLPLSSVVKRVRDCWGEPNHLMEVGQYIRFILNQVLTLDQTNKTGV